MFKSPNVRGCPNTQRGKAGGTGSPVKMRSDIGAPGCGLCKNCFSGICWWLKIRKRDKIYKRNQLSTVSIIIFLFCICLFDICLFARREYYYYWYSYFESLPYSYNERPMLVFSCCGPKPNLVELTSCLKHIESSLIFLVTFEIICQIIKYCSH